MKKTMKNFRLWLARQVMPEKTIVFKGPQEELPLIMGKIIKQTCPGYHLQRDGGPRHKANLELIKKLDEAT